MQAKTKPIPNGYHSITPYLTVDNAKQAIDFYTRAFGEHLLDVHVQRVTQLEKRAIRVRDSEVMPEFILVGLLSRMRSTSEASRAQRVCTPRSGGAFE